jgi:hypothetical protein
LGATSLVATTLVPRKRFQQRENPHSGADAREKGSSKSSNPKVLRLPKVVDLQVVTGVLAFREGKGEKLRWDRQSPRHEQQLTNDRRRALCTNI